jgi:hypothetical protein
MTKLQENWLTDGLLDFEYKKYVLLAYLQSVKASFLEQKLYPEFNELILHYRNLLKLRDQKELLNEQFPKELDAIDREKLTLSYRKMLEDDEFMKVIEELVHFALPMVKSHLEAGKELYEFVEEHLEVVPVGIWSLYADEGFVLLTEQNKSYLNAYNYKMTVFQSEGENYRGLHLKLIESGKKRLGETYENIKLRLARQFKLYSNPATYLVVSKLNCPFEETLFPITKRVLVKHIAKMAS